MSVQTFMASLVERKGGGVAIQIPFDPPGVWGPRDRYDVTGSIAGQKVRGKLTRRDDGYWLEMGPAWCRHRSINAEDSVKVQLGLEGPQLDNIGPDFASALEAEPHALQFFNALPTFYRKNFVRWIDSAKRPETRAKRIADTVSALKSGKREL